MTQAKLDAGMPAFIECIGPAYPLFAQAAVHMREGYIFHPDRSVQIYSNGNAHFFLVLGNPGQAAIDMAQDAREHALRQQQVRYEEDVQKAAKAMMEAAKREEITKQLAEVEATHAKALAKLKKETEAQLAALSQ